MPRELNPSPPESIASTGNSAKSPRSVQSIVTGSRDSNGSKQSRIDPTNINYRSDVLALNRVVFKSSIDPFPENVAAVVKKILVRCESPEIDDATATKVRDKIIQLGEDAEGELGHGFLTMDILPPKARWLSWGGLPTAIQTICEPRPDVTYGYTLQSFTLPQQITQRNTYNGVDLSKYSRPAKDLYWPFFIVEFEAPAAGGNIYAAANQCAGGGSASLLAAHALYTVASQGNYVADVTDSVAYSAAIDGDAANLHVHWYEVGDGTYYLERIHRYNFDRPDDIQKFQQHTKNIVDWGLGTRLEKIKRALDVILEEELEKKQQQMKRHGEPLSPSTS